MLPGGVIRLPLIFCLVSAIGCLASNVVINQAMAAEPWSVKQFEVIAVAAADETRELTLERAARDVQRLVQESGVTDPYFPTLFRTLPIDVELQTTLENYLGQVAAQYETWGLRSPALQPLVQNRSGQQVYRVFLVSNLEQAAGEYHLRCYSISGQILLLNRNSITANGRITGRGYQTIAHELFHAVEYSYPFFQCDHAADMLGNWIVEGMARAVGWDTATLLRPLDVSNWAMERWGARNYNSRLPVPLSVSDGSPVDPYRTNSFWHYLAERQAGKATGYKPGPEEASIDYSYLPLFFSGGEVSRDCNSLGDPCKAEMDWLNARILAVFGTDLRTAFNNFAESLPLYPENRSGSLDEINWLTSIYGNDDCQGVPFGGTWSRKVHRDVISSFRENSIQCFNVTFEEFENDVLIEFKVTAPPGGTDIKNLTFALSGRPIQAMPAKVVIDNDTREPSASWVVRVPADEENYLTITNVADIPSRTTPMTNLPYTVTVLKEFASMGSGGGGPSASDIDTPLPMELNTIKQSYLVPGPLPEHTAIGMDEVCLLQLIFEDSRTGDGLVLRMDIEGPIRPGTYPIYEGGIHDAKKNPGQFFARFGIGSGNALGQGFEMGYKARGGTVTLDTVSRHYIRGTANIIGHNGKPTHCKSPSGEDAYFNPVGNFIACPGPQDMVVQAKFGVIPELTPGLGRLGKTLEECVNVTPLPPEPEEVPDDPSPSPGTDTPTGTPPVDPPPGTGSGSDGQPGESSEPGAGEPDVAGESSQSGTPSEAELEATRRGPRWAIIHVTGDVTDTIVMSEPSMVGGCSGQNPFSIGLHEGDLRDEGLANWSMTTQDTVATGQTGPFALSEFIWDYGTVPVENMPPELNIRVPNRFEGSGMLDLIAHDPSLENRHMQGVVRALGMRNREGQVVDLEMEFRVNWSCGIRQ